MLSDKQMTEKVTMILENMLDIMKHPENYTRFSEGTYLEEFLLAGVSLLEQSFKESMKEKQAIREMEEEHGQHS